jgi:hypothetical protein
MNLDLHQLRSQLSALAASPPEIPAEEATSLVAELAHAQSALLAMAHRAPTINSSPQEPPPAASAPACGKADLFTIDEAAAMLRVSPRWLYRHAKNLPFSRKLSRKVLRFSRAGIARWLATRRT